MSDTAREAQSSRGRLSVLRSMLDALPELPDDGPPFENLARHAPAIRHEGKLEDVLASLRLVIGSSGVAVVLVEFGGAILFANHCATCLLGFEHAGGLIGKRLEDVVDAEDLKIIRTIVARSALTGSRDLLRTSFPLRAYRSSGDAVCLRALITVETSVPGCIIVGVIFEEVAPCFESDESCRAEIATKKKRRSLT